MEVSLIATGNEPVRLYYSINGANHFPRRYTKPFVIEEDSVVAAHAVAADGRRSREAAATYRRIPHDWKISLQSNYSSQYNGGGDFALIDGVRGILG
jgi:hypothetical protein